MVPQPSCAVPPASVDCRPLCLPSHQVSVPHLLPMLKWVADAPGEAFVGLAATSNGAPTGVVPLSSVLCL